MKKFFLILLISLFSISGKTYSQQLPEINQKISYRLSDKKSPLKDKGLPSSGASVGFNLGLGIIEGEAAFAIGAFAELKASDFAFVPQANYWNGSNKSDFELAGLARFYLSKKSLVPYLDGGLGVNFYNSEKQDLTKLSILIGGGIELTNLGTAFNLIFDGKYKLIINDSGGLGNLSCFIFTAGMKFPFK